MLKATCLSLAAASLLLVTPNVWAGANAGDRAPEFVSVKDTRGRRIKLRSYRSKVVVVTFGASWCKPCKKELPALSRLANQYQRVKFIAINIDKNRAKGRRFVRRYVRSGRIRAGFDPSSSTVQLYSPPSMPSTYVIGKYGVIRYRHKGYRSGDESKLARRLRKLLRK